MTRRTTLKIVMGVGAIAVGLLAVGLLLTARRGQHARLYRQGIRARRREIEVSEEDA